MAQNLPEPGSTPWHLLTIINVSNERWKMRKNHAAIFPLTCNQIMTLHIEWHFRTKASARGEKSNLATLTYKAPVLIFEHIYAGSMMPLQAGWTPYSRNGFIICSRSQQQESLCSCANLPSPPHIQANISASFTVSLQTGHISCGVGVRWETRAVRAISGDNVISMREYPGHR